MSSPVVHSVHFYDHDEALVSRLHNIIVSSLESGSSVLVVGTPEHRRQLGALLTESGFQSSKTEDRVWMLDAKETLDKFMLHGHPSDRLFTQIVVKLINDVKQAAKNEQRALTVFGEMVAVLWSEGNKAGALELERMWNDALQDRSFHLHCAYPRSILKDAGSNVTVKAICDEHSTVLGHAQRARHSAA
jgi:MEDS: MEthanogen/methylotroph, DcmR Sensory domain